MYLRRHNHSYLWNYFQLDLFPPVHQMVEQLRHNWSPIIPNFDIDLVSSPRTSQSSQFSDSMPSPTTGVASNQSSQLAHPSYFSNPALMDDSNLPSLHLATNSLPTPTRGRSRRRETSPAPPRSPISSTPHQRPRIHTYASHFLSTLTISPSRWPTLLLCNNEPINQIALSIKRFAILFTFDSSVLSTPAAPTWPALLLCNNEFYNLLSKAGLMNSLSIKSKAEILVGFTFLWASLLKLLAGTSCLPWLVSHGYY